MKNVIDITKKNKNKKAFYDFILYLTLNFGKIKICCDLNLILYKVKGGKKKKITIILDITYTNTFDKKI